MIFEAWTKGMLVGLGVVVALGLGCSKDEEAGELGDACTPDASEEEGACAAGLVCEPAGEGYQCAGPIEIRGMVIDALDESPIEGARVLALDDTGAPLGEVAVSDAAGMYVLPLSVPRDADGNPSTTLTLTLSGSAADYQIYPSGLQPAFPVSTSDIQDAEDDPDDDSDDNLRYIENASTTIGLLPLDEADKGGFTISGRIGAADADADVDGAGTLVVAEGVSSSYTIADEAGAFTLFNVQPGAHTVRGYRGGLQLVPEELEVDADVEGVVLELAGDGTATVSGSVNIVNAPGGSATSVVLIPAALFNEAFEFGPVPFALRAPEPGVEANVSSNWSIPGVPAGTYKVIASLENDLLVRDPDTSIAGTEILEITVAAGEDIEIQDSFKVTEALAVIGPGADEPESVTGTPTFEFADDSSEDRYDVVVHDALGNEIWRDDQVPGVSGSATVTVEYDGPALTPGMYYRIQATSWKDGNPAPSALSRTEDLRGVFVYAE